MCAQLRNMLAAEDSAVMAQKNDHGGTCLPERAQTNIITIRIGQNNIRKRLAQRRRHLSSPPKHVVCRRQFPEQQVSHPIIQRLNRFVPLCAPLGYKLPFMRACSEAARVPDRSRWPGIQTASASWKQGFPLPQPTAATSDSWWTPAAPAISNTNSQERGPRL